mgnify:CR=1 FL=1
MDYLLDCWDDYRDRGSPAEGGLVLGAEVQLLLQLVELRLVRPYPELVVLKGLCKVIVLLLELGVLDGKCFDLFGEVLDCEGVLVELSAQLGVVSEEYRDQS